MKLFRLLCALLVTFGAFYVSPNRASGATVTNRFVDSSTNPVVTLVTIESKSTPLASAPNTVMNWRARLTSDANGGISTNLFQGSYLVTASNNWKVTTFYILVPAGTSTYNMNDITTAGITNLTALSPAYLQRDGTFGMQGNLFFTGATSTVVAASVATTERNAMNATNGMIVYNTTTGVLNKYESGAWSAFGSGGGSGATVAWAITNLNTLTNNTQNFEVGNAGTDFAVSSSGSMHTWNLPDASASARGALTSTDWTTFNGKVGPSRSISTTSPLSGGGTLAADRTLSIGGLSSLGSANQLVRSTGGAWEYVTYGTGTSGVDWNISSGSGILTFNLPTASRSVTGKLSSTDYTTLFDSRQLTNANLTTLAAGGSSARSFLGLAIGSDVQAYSANLANWALHATNAFVDLNTAWTTNTFLTGGNGSTAPTRRALIVQDLPASIPATKLASSTGSINFNIASAKLPAANAARIDQGEFNTRLLFDATTAQTNTWQFVMPQDYAGTPVCRIIWSATSATTGTGAWKVSVMAVAGGASADANTESYDTANSTGGITVPGTAGYITATTLTLSNADSVAAGNWVKLKVERDVATDTATGDLEIIGFEFGYTKN